MAVIPKILEKKKVPLDNFILPATKKVGFTNRIYQISESIICKW